LGVDRLPITSVKLDLSEKVPLTVAAVLADAEVVFPVVTLVLVVALVLTPRVAANAPKGRLANTRATIGRASFFMINPLDRETLAPKTTISVRSCILNFTSV
jgi:hypothetical protein